MPLFAFVILQTDLEEERQKLKRAKRTGWDKAKLYLLRLVINLIVFAILAGAAYLIYYTSDFAVLVSLLNHNLYSQLRPCLVCQ